jgi:hypothetical protein
MTYVKNYKQADLTLTGTMRKAQLAATATKASRRPNGLHHADSPGPGATHDLKRRASTMSTVSHLLYSTEDVRQCDKCHIKFSPKWWPVAETERDEEKVLCHKCHWSTAVQNEERNGDLAEAMREKLGHLVERQHQSGPAHGDSRVSVA